MGAMNRGLNLPQIQRIMQEFERESATMDMKEEMMSDAVDDVMEDDLEDEEEEGDKILKQVLDEIGVDLSQQVRSFSSSQFPGFDFFSGVDSSVSFYSYRSSMTHPLDSLSLRRLQNRGRLWPWEKVVDHPQQQQVAVEEGRLVVCQMRMPSKPDWMLFEEVKCMTDLVTYVEDLILCDTHFTMER